MRQRSFFWPFIFIATGVVWFLVNLHFIPVGNLWALLYIWPFFLMAVGVGLILRSRWPVARMIVSGLIVLGMLLAIVFAPQLGWNRAPAWNYFDFSNFGGPIRGSGVVVSQARQVADFNSVEIDFPAELTIQQGDPQSLTIQAEDNLLPQLATRVSGSRLYIEDTHPNWNERVNPTRPVVIHMTVKDLQNLDFPTAGTVKVESLSTDRLQVSISGAGTLTLSGLKVKDLSVDLSGAGNIRADGSADALQMDISGMGGFQAPDLASQTAVIDISGAGSATVWAKSDLSVNISGTGSVSYYGSPSVHRDVSGLGSVHSLGNK